MATATGGRGAATSGGKSPFIQPRAVDLDTPQRFASLRFSDHVSFLKISHARRFGHGSNVDFPDLIDRWSS
jgi:hypothetical protein